MTRFDTLLVRVLWVAGLLLIAEAALAKDVMLDRTQMDEMFGRAEREGRVGLARKSREVDARPAVPGEVIVTIIKGEGEETRSPPAKEGDWVVRNRCAETGFEEYLVQNAEFSQRYEAASGGDATSRVYKPKSLPVRYLIVPADQGAFSFPAPWGNPMKARPGDAIVRDPIDPAHTYRVAAISFACTYEIVEKRRASP